MSNHGGSLADMLVHGGRPDAIEGRHVNMSIELGSTMVFDTLAAFEAARDARYESGTRYYGRYGNEAVYKLEALLASLEGADDVTLTSSGVAAISTALLTLARPGTHLLVADNVYGNTRGLCDNLIKALGVEVQYFDPMIGSDVDSLIRPTTCAIMFEAPGSGTFEFPDIGAIADAARRRNVPTVLDSTWLTPVFCRPLELGIDVIVYSGSKYLSGHSDAMLGVTASRGKIGARIRKTVMAIGDKTSAQDIMLTLRGARTLEMRMHHADRSGRDMAAWFAAQPAVNRVLHPALPSCPGHEHWQHYCTGAAALFGVVFHRCSEARIRRFVDALQHFGIGVSWGGYESLVLPVAPVRTAQPWASIGHLVRFAIGFDDPATLKTDLGRAMVHLDMK